MQQSAAILPLCCLSPRHAPRISRLLIIKDLPQQLEQKSPELAALAAEIRSKEKSIELAKLQYVPDFSLSGSTDLGGITQNLMAMATVPAEHEGD